MYRFMFFCQFYFCGWFSEAKDELKTVVSEALGGIVGSLKDNVLAPLIGGIVQPMLNGEMKLVDVLFQSSIKMDTTISGFCDLNYVGYSSLKTVAQQLYSYVAVIGLGMCILFWLVSLTDKLTKDQLNVYILIKSFIELIFSILIVTCGFEGFWWLANVSTELTEKVKGSISGINRITTQTPYKMFLFGGWDYNPSAPAGGTNLAHLDTSTWESALVAFPGLMTGLFSVILALIYWAFNTLVQAFMVATCVSRAIQLAIFVTMAPIGACQVFNKGSILDSSAMQYIKRILALSIQGPIIMMISFMSQSIMSSMSAANQLTQIGMLFAIPLVTLGLTLKSQSIANDILA